MAAPQTTRLVTPFRAVLALALLVVSVLTLLFATLGTTSRPTIQVPLAMEGMPPHKLNVWIRSNPESPGTTEFIGQVVDGGGNPRNVSSIDFGLIDDAGTAIWSAAGASLPADNRADAGRFGATVSLPRPRQGDLEIVVLMGGRTGKVRLPFSVLAEEIGRR